MNNEQTLINRLLFVLSDLNSNIDPETAELIFFDLCKVTGKTQNEVAQMLEQI